MKNIFKIFLYVTNILKKKYRLYSIFFVFFFDRLKVPSALHNYKKNFKLIFYYFRIFLIQNLWLIFLYISLLLIILHFSNVSLDIEIFNLLFSRVYGYISLFLLNFLTFIKYITKYLVQQFIFAYFFVLIALIGRAILEIKNNMKNRKEKKKLAYILNISFLVIKKSITFRIQYRLFYLIINNIIFLIKKYCYLLYWRINVLLYDIQKIDFFFTELVISFLEKKKKKKKEKFNSQNPQNTVMYILIYIMKLFRFLISKWNNF
jgi:hypothetical protein